MNTVTDEESGYVLKPGADEIRRLHAQAHILDRSTNPLLSRYVRPGMNCVEIGCGLGSSTQQIADLVGRSGRVTALDQSDLYLDYTRRRLEYAGDEGIAFVRASAETYRFPRDLDLVFGRAVLHHVHDPALVFSRAAEGLRVGGLAVFQEPDMGAILAAPIGPAQRQLWTWYMTIGRNEGFDFNVGEHLASIAVASGLAVLEVAAFQPYLVSPDERAILPGLIHTIRSLVLSRRIATEAELDACAAALEAETKRGVSPYLTFVHVVAMKPFDGWRSPSDIRPLEMV
jgi:SAM-dependent methyltransferase